MYAQLQQKVELGGLSASTLNNYGRCIAKIALHFKSLPTELEEIQINGYLQNLSHGPAPSISYFKTSYGYRAYVRLGGPPISSNPPTKPLIGRTSAY
jgi:hypothetical protein